MRASEARGGRAEAGRKIRVQARPSSFRLLFIFSLQTERAAVLSSGSKEAIKQLGRKWCALSGKVRRSGYLCVRGLTDKDNVFVKHLEVLGLKNLSIRVTVPSAPVRGRSSERPLGVSAV